MNIKKTITNLVKISAAGAASLIFSSDVEAQLPGHQINSPRGQYQQQLVDTAPQLLHAQQQVPANQSRSGTNQQPRQRVASGSRQATQARTFVPPHLRSSGVKQVNYSASRFANTNATEGEYIGGETIVGGGCGAGGCSGGCGAGGCGIDSEYGYDMGYDDCGVGCADMCVDNLNPCGYRQIPALISFSDMEFYAGPAAFKGPVNLGYGGSFGFQETINWGFPVPLFQGLGLSGQLGLTATQTNTNGAGFTNLAREQYFATGGLFRRVDFGLQFGVAYDYLQENWYFDDAFGQIRGDLSWVNRYGNTIGFRFANEFDHPNGLGAQATALVPSAGPFNTFVPNDTYRLYLQRPLIQSGGLLDLYAGFSGTSQGIAGCNISVPLTEQVMLKSGATILIDDGSGPEENIDENWNVAVGLVYMPKGWNAWKRAYHRPMFDVADNSSFYLRRN